MFVFSFLHLYYVVQFKAGSLVVFLVTSLKRDRIIILYLI